MREDKLFVYLRTAITKPKGQQARKIVLISVYTWRIDNERVSLRQDCTQDQSHIRRLGHAINTSLRDDMQWQKYGAGEAKEWILGADPPSTRNPGTGLRGVIELQFTACRRLLR